MYCHRKGNFLLGVAPEKYSLTHKVFKTGRLNILGV